MIRCLVLLCVLSGGCGLPAAEAAPLVPDASGNVDLQGWLAAALAAGGQRVVIPPGTYRVQPRERQHLRLTGVHDVEIDATGVELVCTETTRALTLTACRNLTLRGLSIDYDPLCYSQGAITAIEEDGLVQVVELFAGYPPAPAVVNEKYELFSPLTRELCAPSIYPKEIRAVDERHLRVRLAGGPGNPPPGQVGDLVVVNAEHHPGGKQAHAIVSEDCSGLVLDGLTIYGSNCFGYYEHGCRATQVTGCRITRRTDDDPQPRGAPRLRSTDADGFHFADAPVGPTLSGCTVGFNGDDSIAIHGTYHLVVAASGDQLRVLYRPGADDRLPLAVGEAVELCTAEGRRLPAATVVAVAPAPAANDEERAWVGAQAFDERIRKTLVRALQVTLDQPLAVQRGAVIAARDRRGDGYRITGCDLGHNRSRGILAKAGDGVISGNRISGSWGVALCLAPEYWWLEAGCADHTVISGNTIAACRSSSLLVAFRAGGRLYCQPGTFHGLEVTGNAITTEVFPAIRLAGVDDLQLGGNSVAGANGAVAGVRVIDDAAPLRLSTSDAPEQRAAVELRSCTRRASTH